MHIGIWGFGRVGRSALHYFSNQGYTVTIVNDTTLSKEDSALIAHHNAQFKMQNAQVIDNLFVTCDKVLASPGIDVRPYARFHHKLITELDIFASHVCVKTIAITGSLGKTTITTLLTSLLNQAGVKACAAGNIGTPLLEVMHQKPDAFVIEASSFQLEHTRTFAPDIAIWTNLHPNHLDRHGSLTAYCTAKAHILKYQKPHQVSLVPVELIPQLQQRNLIGNNTHFFSLHKPSNKLLQTYQHTRFFWHQADGIMTHCESATSCVVPEHMLPRSSFTINWVLLAATLYIMKLNPHDLTQCDTTALEHRLEYVTTYKEVTYYNDSKSTIGQATYAAVKNFSHKPIVLFGGLSKGVDRTPTITALKNHVKMIICFGAERTQLSSACAQAGITHYSYETLQAACDAALHIAQPGDTVLLSPGGSSFDLFDNYEHRGTVFKEYITSQTV